jgi:hypothetical protein
MPSRHTVQQGEHASRIAANYGFQDYRAIWNHPENAALVKLRQTPNVLLPGDVLFIPDKQIKTEKIPTGKVHRYRLTAPRLLLRIILKEFDDQPIADSDCELEVEGTVCKLKSTKQGLVELEIPATAESGKLRVPALNLEVPLKIGHLDPIEEVSGWKARLFNLGYYHGGEEARLKVAVEEFQGDHGLERTGEPDDATRAKLRELHGY